MNEIVRSLPSDVSIAKLEDGSVGMRTIEATERDEFQPSLALLGAELYMRQQETESRLNRIAQVAGVSLAAAKIGAISLGVDIIVLLTNRGQTAIIPVPVTVLIFSAVLIAGAYGCDFAKSAKEESTTELRRFKAQMSEVTRVQDIVGNEFGFFWRDNPEFDGKITE